MKTRFLIYLLFFSILAACASAASQKVVQKKDYFDSSNFVFASAAFNGVFEVFAVNNILLIKYGEHKIPVFKIGIYNSRSGVMALTHNTFREASFFHIKSDKFRLILNDIVENSGAYRKGEKLDQVRRLFTGNLPYITSSGKFQDEVIWERIEGVKNFAILQANGMPLANFRSYDGRRSDETIYEATIAAKPDQFIEKINDLGNVFGVEKRKKVIVRPKIVDKSGFFDHRDIIDQQIVYDEKAGIYDVKVFSRESPFSIKVTPDHYSLPYQEAGYVLEPVVEVTGKKFSIIYPNLTFLNPDIAIDLKQVIASQNVNFVTLAFSYNISNRGVRNVFVKKISLYVYESVFTWSSAADMPPKVILKNQNLTTQSIVPDMALANNTKKKDIADLKRDIEEYQQATLIKSAVDFIGQEMSINKAEKTRIKLGVSVLYDVQGKEQTLHVLKEVPFSEILAEK